MRNCSEHCADSLVNKHCSKEKIARTPRSTCDLFYFGALIAYSLICSPLNWLTNSSILIAASSEMIFPSLRYTENNPALTAEIRQTIKMIKLSSFCFMRIASKILSRTVNTFFPGPPGVPWQMPHAHLALQAHEASPQAVLPFQDACVLLPVRA